MRLSKNFNLDEFLVSQTAERLGIDMTPSDEIVDNINLLVVNIMQPIRDSLGMPIFISSGYRPERLNSMIGGSTSSAHLVGHACDFIVTGYRPIEVCRAIRDRIASYDQNIHEFGRWTHVGRLDLNGNSRNQDLTAYRKDDRTQYEFGLHELEDLL